VPWHWVASMPSSPLSSLNLLISPISIMCSLGIITSVGSMLSN
jgi:hypothetical protein